VHPAGGTRRVFKQVSGLEAGPVKAVLSRPAHQRVTPTVGQPRAKVNEKGETMFPENNYDAGKFTDIASVWGNQLWEFLNEPSIVRSMIDASDNKRPAAEAIAPELVERFGNDIKQDRVKQFIGFLIRQVMEQNGYSHTAYGQQTKENPVFVKASRYSSRNE